MQKRTRAQKLEQIEYVARPESSSVKWENMDIPQNRVSLQMSPAAAEPSSLY